ncbi:hypothetical protein CLV30_11981 [Haloactinopolyspora alba]|uniref:Uncharacterized protein n=1 Tax=Haloactinopolyspora alba TaxID=648780 RepID=A0A2P8DNA6_9ACTN|nr:hypothetical protein [Haloactinopolyspora alba]PSK98698.1 hypothetical protein CLV30_11981 [Haloactinopolyspora alba]
MSDENRTAGPLRLGLLIIAGVVVANVVLATATERDSGLGLDELVALLAGVALGVVAEYGVFRRR